MIRSINLGNSNIIHEYTNKVDNTANGDFDAILNRVTSNAGGEQPKSLNDIFNAAAEKFNVSVNLLKAIAKQESNFNATAVSKSGAKGIMQLMPKTAEYLGVKDSFDPEQNIMGGAKYISEMLNKYNGNVKLALAAYNAGSGNVSKYGGIPPFKETQNYVVKVMNYMNNEISVPNSSNTLSAASNTGDLKDVKVTIGDETYSYDDYLEYVEEFKKELSSFYEALNIDSNMNVMNKIYQT